jgi:hypothetical protein
MAAIIDSRESEKIFVAGARQFIAGRAAIMTALTTSCLLVTTARAGDFAALEKKSGETGSSAPEDADAIADTGLDATVLSSRVQLTNEFKDQEFGAAKDTLTLNLAYAFANRSRPDWTAQVDLPVVHYDAGNVTGVESGTGFGDISFRMGHVIHGEGIFRYAAGVEAEFDTAGGSPLGDGIFRLSPIVTFAVQPCHTFKFQTFAQFNQSLITETGIAEKREIHLKPAVNFDLPGSWYFYTECEEAWALQAHGGFSSTLKFEIGHGFGTRGQWVLSARCEMLLTSSSDDYTVTASCTYTLNDSHT